MLFHFLLSLNSFVNVIAAPHLAFISRYNLCSNIKTHLQSSTSINPSTKSTHDHDDDGRKQPIFPGAIAINTEDISTCINQTGQTAPANALLGKPSKSKCKHGYTQVFSLDPMPSNKYGMERLNSGLIKLTCPLLVNAIDVMEDDKFMNDINAKLISSNLEENKLVQCMNDAHKVHAETRKELIFGDDNSDCIEESDKYKLLESKLGERGAKYFIEAGVAGANPLSKKVDVKCLHAWLGDYLMRSDTIAEHPIGDMIIKELDKRGIDISGTDDCHTVCSGCSTDTSTSVQVPIPRNRQRKKRRQIQLNDKE